MPILRFVIVLTLIELFGCSAFEPAHESIESEYPEANESYDVCDLQLDGVKFLSGVWFETTQTCLFSLVAGEVWLPRPIDSSRDYIRVQMQDCDGLSESYRRLETAVLKT